jgi:adenylate cyclase
MRNRFSHWLLVKQRKSFYIVLAALLSVFFIFDQASTHLVRGMQHSTFDWLLSHRLNYKAPDRDIVIIDIDDASLAALSDRYGRWPWPRDLMAKVTTGLMQAEPKAVVFDIVFSESDRLNPDSDALFARAVAASSNIFVPMVLLDDLDPHKTAAPNIPTAQKVANTAQADTQLSVLQPYFASSVRASQLGTNNVEPDQDGVIRRFELFQEHHGWRLSSIAEQVRQGLSVPRPEDNSILLNWRGGAFSYPFVSFSTVASMIDSGDLAHLQKDFRGKIVLVGSTAASLFDIRSTPMAKVHPGVEILATVIDNLKNGDDLREPPSWLIAVLSVAFVFLLAWMFHSQRHTYVSDVLFVGLQLVLLATAFIAFNLGRLYLDMSVPITAGLVYFTIARAHAALAENALTNHYRYFVNPAPGDQLVVGVIALSLPEGARLDDALAHSPLGAGRVQNIFAPSKLLAPAMAATTIVYWLVPTIHAADMRQDAERLQSELGLERQGRLFEAGCVWSQQSGAGQITRQLCVDALAHESFSTAQQGTNSLLSGNLPQIDLV